MSLVTAPVIMVKKKGHSDPSDFRITPQIIEVSNH